MYKGLEEVVLHGETTPSSQGKRIILPSSFTGGARYMLQNYQDTMAICKWAWYPDLFITFTCNPKLKTIYLSNKFILLLRAVIYTIEFQKRGLPHAHILLFLHEHNKYPTTVDIDQIITAEIPNEAVDPHYYRAVKSFMMHDSCGSARKSSPCMQNGRCTKCFPKKFTEPTTIDEDDYPIYRRKDNGRTIKKDGIDLDNRYVVPHNRFLLLKYGAHINVEWCNQSRSIKYLFQYVNKGNDRATAAFSRSVQEEGSSVVDEINMYYHCRYISPCEAAWRIFKFPIHYRQPSVERLSFHLPNEQHVIFSDDDQIDDVANRPTLFKFHNIYVLSEAELTDDELKNCCLQKLEIFLKGCGRSFQDFPIMPKPLYSEGEGDHSNRLIHDELCYNRCSMLEEHQQLLRNLTAEQKSVYEKIMAAVIEAKGGLFFSYGYEGIDKTFIWKTLSSVHSRFAIPLNPIEDSTCNIKQGSPLAKLIVKAKLIIWDEAPMMHRYCFEALDQTLRDILRFKDTSSLDRPFGGKTVVLGGDFREILPVITKGTRQDIVNASLNSSYLWPHCEILKLTRNMRLQGNQLGPHLDELKEFSDWILAIGDGRIGSSTDGIKKVRIPDDLLIHNCDDPISAIVESTYPDFFKHYNDMITSKEEQFSLRLLTWWNLSMTLDHVHTLELLNSIKCSGVPNHSITLKVGVPVMLLKKIDQSSGLCNGTRLIITKLENRVIEAKVLSVHQRFITTKGDKLAQGVTGLIQSHISPPSFLWHNPQSSKLFDVELISQSFIPRDFGIAVDNTAISGVSAIFDIGNRLG
ncbi:PREDICTED: uncharacterized protein LOC109208909 [Nicotiana attenuata]|uniref:uncharacterized protein LOC109208909 n=1 Tax=Nicotiana attenuata TaxID=49451 RepID=UPI000905D28B|nr:PREDICTED: uncharacterized protein LOC109208909 [Nicotiana attenuata]